MQVAPITQETPYSSSFFQAAPTAADTPWSTVGYLTYKRCVTVDTPVLTWDFKWVPAGELVEGQELLAFDENLQGIGRYLRKAEVVHNTIEDAECVEVELENGEKLYCTPDHSWLVKLAGNKLEWREAKDLLETKKHGPVYLPKMFGDVWLNKNLTYDDGYIAAALDGEGSLDRTNSFSFTQTDNEMLHKVDAIFTAKRIPFKIRPKAVAEGRKPCFDIKVFGMKNILQTLGGLGSVRLARKLRDNLEKRPQRMRCGPDDMVKVVAVRKAGTRKIAVLQTTTATHFTAGYPSHNTYARRLNPDDSTGRTEEWSDTVQRVVSAANDQLGCGFTEDEQRRLESYLKGLKGTVAGRFLWQLGTPFVSRNGLASLQNCFSSSVKAITYNGTATLGELYGRGPVGFLYDNRWVTGYVEKFGQQDIYEVAFKRPGKSNHSLVYQVTRDHRWELIDGTITTTLKVGDKVPTSVYDNYVEDNDGWLHGFIFGDGTHNYTYANGDYGYMARLCGKKEQYKNRFDRYSYQPNCSGDPVAYHRSSVNYKEFPREGASADYIASFIAGWMAADASLTPSGSYVLSSQAEGAYSWLVDNAAYAGFIVTGMSVYTGDTNYGPRSAPLYKITLSKEQKYLEVVSYEYLGVDDVYCAVVPGVERFTLAGGLLTCNCAFTTVDSPRAFTWAFDLLMLGSGVGYNIQREFVDELHPVHPEFKAPTRNDNAGASFIVPDSREGWVELLQRVLDFAFVRGGTFDYSTQLIRSKGAPIKGFGGTASGPEDLVWGIGEISRILESRRGAKLRPIDCLDIMNIIGAIVVAGNVRRSAQIALGDYDDVEFLRAKRWDLGNIPSWRAMSNNSVVCSDVSKLPEEFWEGYKGNGEPYGLINLDLSRAVGRLFDNRYPDPDVAGFNPLNASGFNW